MSTYEEKRDDDFDRQLQEASERVAAWQQWKKDAFRWLDFVIDGTDRGAKRIQKP